MLYLNAEAQEIKGIMWNDFGPEIHPFDLVCKYEMQRCDKAAVLQEFESVSPMIGQ
jgi:hypothetical protein